MNTMALALRLARRELRAGLKGFAIFLACIALGVAAIAGVGMVRSAIEAGLQGQGAILLGGDVELRFGYRFATGAEQEWMQANARKVSAIVDFRSMAVVGDDRSLVQVKAVDDTYPLKGAPQLDHGTLAEALAPKGGVPGGVMEKVLVDRLGMQVGDHFTLGLQTFHLGAVLLRESDSAAGGFALGPRVIVKTADLDKSGLIAPGTIYETDYRSATRSSARRRAARCTGAG